jgi:hypothetical protein
MKFSFDISDEEFEYMYDGRDFRNAVMSTAVDSIMHEMVYDTGKYYNAIKDSVVKIINENKKEIVKLATQAVVDRVSEEVIAKRNIKELIPKASEINAINKENEKYFLELIDKAIAKRFGQKIT